MTGDEKTKTLKNLVPNCCTALFLRLLMDNTIPITHQNLKISVFFIDTMLIFNVLGSQKKQLCIKAILYSNITNGLENVFVR